MSLIIKTMKHTQQWFSIIEVMIGIFIFTIGFLSIYALLLSTFGLNRYSQNSLVASHLAREGIELVRNIRDNNFKDMYLWNKLPGGAVDDFFKLDTPYTIENNFVPSSTGDVILKEIVDFWEWESEMMRKMISYELCLTAEHLYTYDCTTSVPKWAKFWRYIRFSPVIDDGWTQVQGAMRLTSKVIWYDTRYNEVSIDTILTDFLRR